MSPPKDYDPIKEFPDVDGSAGLGPLRLQEDGDEVLWWQTWRNDYAIASTSATTPIVVTTTLANPFVSGQKIRILGSGDGAAEGTHTITVLTSTTFSLTGTTADGGSGAGGRVWDPKLGLLSRLIDGLSWLWNNIGAGALGKFWHWGSGADFDGDVLADNLTALSECSANTGNFVDVQTVTLEASGAATVGGNLGVTGTVTASVATISGAMTAKNVIYSGFGASASGTMANSTTETRTGSTTRSGASATVANRRVAVDVSATNTIAPESGDQFTVDGTAVASGIGIVLAAPAGGAALGPLWFSRRGSGPHDLHFFQPNGSTGLATLLAVTTATGGFGALWDGGAWVVVGSSVSNVTVP